MNIRLLGKHIHGCLVEIMILEVIKRLYKLLHVLTLPETARAQSSLWSKFNMKPKRVSKPLQVFLTLNEIWTRYSTPSLRTIGLSLSFVISPMWEKQKLSYQMRINGITKAIEFWDIHTGEVDCNVISSSNFDCKCFYYNVTTTFV